jgi:hypothetical protein
MYMYQETAVSSMANIIVTAHRPKYN